MAIFSKKDKVDLDQQSISTLISEGCLIEGNMKAPAFVRIDGQLTGDIFIDEGLILGEKGLIKGNITTKEMVVYGTVNGNIKVSTLEIKSTGKVNGEITTQILSVENGAIYNGSLSMAQSSSSSKPEAKLNGHQQKAIEAAK